MPLRKYLQLVSICRLFVISVLCISGMYINMIGSDSFTFKFDICVQITMNILHTETLGLIFNLQNIKIDF